MAGRSKRIFIALRDRVTSLPDYNFLTKKRDEEEKKEFKQAAASSLSGLQKPAECKKLA